MAGNGDSLSEVNIGNVTGGILDGAKTAAEKATEVGKAVKPIAHTETEETIRVISMRKATKNEQRVTFAGFAD